MSLDLAEGLKKVLEGNSRRLIVEECFIHHINTVNKTCVLEPIDNLDFNPGRVLPAEFYLDPEAFAIEPENQQYVKNFYFGARYSLDGASSLFTPSAKSYCIAVQLDGNLDGNKYMLGLSDASKLSLGGGVIVMDTKDAQALLGTDPDNKKSRILFAVGAIKFDLSGKSGAIAEITDDYVEFSGFPKLTLQSKCGSSIVVDCDGITNTLVNDNKFYLGKTGEFTYKPDDCKVLQPETDVSNDINKIVAMVKHLYDFATSKLNVDELSSKLNTDLNAMTGETTDVAIAIDSILSDAARYKDKLTEPRLLAFFFPSTASLLELLPSRYDVNTSQYEKYWHSDYVDFSKRVQVPKGIGPSNLARWVLDTLIITINRTYLGNPKSNGYITSYLKQLGTLNLKLFSFNEGFSDKLADTTIKLLLSFNNDFNYSVERRNCNSNVVSQTQTSEKAVTLKILLDNLNTAVNSITAATKDLISAGATAQVAPPPAPPTKVIFTGQIPFEKAISDTEKIIEGLFTDIDFLLK